MHYKLRCVHCGKLLEEAESGFLLDCPGSHGPSLLRAVYRESKLSVHAERPGIFRYADWLPIRRILESPGRPIVFRSSGLGDRLGLDRLFIAFSGYWPERGALLETCSFKELEAVSVCARTSPRPAKTMVVASAGNTGRAFLQICSIANVPILVVVPEFALPDMWMTVDKAPCVKLAVVRGDADYFEAIELAGAVSSLEGFYGEGGARNVARRDGMGTVLLAAIEEMGELPAHYFQAVGSGTGGIAAWEMWGRLRADGSYGPGSMKLHFVQNEPFDLMARAWRLGNRELPLLHAGEAKEKTSRLHAKVLSNRKPPYGIAGGVFDALTDTGGSMYTVTGAEAREAGETFEQLEGCTMDPAAEVALAGFMRAARAGVVGRNEPVLLNVTGGGAARIKDEGKTRRVEADFYLDADDAKDITRLESILHAEGAGRIP